MKKKIIIISSVAILLVLAVIAAFSMNNSYFDGKESVSAYDDIFEAQKVIDKEIENYQNDKNYTLENPKVLLNPYKISPLTALIIFQTEAEESVDVEVNGVHSTKMQAENKHLIPIYGMYADYENKIKLTLGSGESNEITIKTDAYQGDPVTVEKTSEKVQDNLYMISPNFVNNCIVDGNGNVLWYLLGDYAGDIEYLENGHFYISDPNQGRNGVKINYSSFVEMDYLGKIYKQWITEFGLHHELEPLSNNKMMVLGANDNSDFFDSYIYIMDLETSEIIKYIDMYQLLHDIDSEFVENLGKDFDLVNNSAEYNEETGELLISLRGLNSLMKLDFETCQIKWIFGNPQVWGEKFSQYMLKVIDDTRFLGGQHSAFTTKDGLIGIHNNDIDQFDLKESNLQHYLDRYSTCDLYEVDEVNKTIKTVWQYTANKEQFSNVAGHMEILENGDKLITYGWSMKREAYNNPKEILYTDPNYKNGVIIQIDENNQELLKMTMPCLIYRTYKIEKFYEENTANYFVQSFNRINGTKFEGQTVKTSSLKNELDNSTKYDKEVEIITNRISITDDFKIEDSVEILFVNENGDTLIEEYKASGKEGPKTFNSGFASKKINLPEGRYAVYVKINNDYFDVNKIVEF